MRTYGQHGDGLMTKADLDDLLFLGRPVKPLAFAIMLSVATVFWFNIIHNTDVIVASPAGDAVGAAAGASAVLLFAGWWLRSQTMAELGLVLASGVWMARTVSVALLYGFDNHAFWYSVAWTVAASSTYLLESWKTDDGLCRYFARGHRHVRSHGSVG